MLFLRSWLEDYIRLDDLSDQQIAGIVTSKSSEVEEIIKHIDYYNAKVLVGKIINVRPHENASTLKIFDVDCGSRGVFQIVSAAENVIENLVIPLALVGANLGFMSIAERNLRGITSYGMCLGKNELLLESLRSPGLWELHQDFPTSNDTLNTKLGQPICEVFPDLFPSESVYDIKVLPNRMSEIGHHAGMALDIALCLNDLSRLTEKGQELLYPEKFVSKKFELISKLKKDDLSLKSYNDKEAFSSIFNLLRVKFDGEFGLPTKISKRLFLTQKNIQLSLVDYTNYWLYDFGAPTHIYSTQKLFGSSKSIKINLDRTESVEYFTGLGNFGKAPLPPSTAIIRAETDNGLKSMVIPGVIGALETAFEYTETDGIFEVANFNFEKVARTAFKTKYRSDGSRVWAGGVNRNLNPYTIYRILSDLTGFEISFVSGYFDGKLIETTDDFVKELTKVFEEKVMIDLDLEFISRRYQKDTTADLTDQIETILSTIGNYTTNTLTAPKYFSNLTSKEDVLEEVTRFLGFENIKKNKISLGSAFDYNYSFEKKEAVKKLLTNYGFDEVKTRPFVGKGSLIDPDDSVIKVVKPYNSNEPYLRDNLVCTLLKITSENLLRGFGNLNIFEINNINTINIADQSLREIKKIACITTDADPYRLTSFLNNYLKLVNENTTYTIEKDEFKFSNFGKSKAYKDQNGKTIARIIQISNQVKKKYLINISKSIWALEMNYLEISKVNNYNKYFDESEYPSVKRSYSFLVSKATEYQQVKAVFDSINSGESIKVYVNPVERLQQDDKDILNIEVNFVNYSKTFNSEYLENYEKTLFSKLQVLDSTILLR